MTSRHAKIRAREDSLTFFLISLTLSCYSILLFSASSAIPPFSRFVYMRLLPLRHYPFYDSLPLTLPYSGCTGGACTLHSIAWDDFCRAALIDDTIPMALVPGTVAQRSTLLHAPPHSHVFSDFLEVITKSPLSLLQRRLDCFLNFDSITNNSFQNLTKHFILSGFVLYI